MKRCSVPAVHTLKKIFGGCTEPNPLMTPIKIDHHRNGVSGQPFYIGIIRDADNSKKLIIQFDDSRDTAVLDMGLLKKDIIEFGVNSWRGDLYQERFRAMINIHEMDLADLPEAQI